MSDELEVVVTSVLEADEEASSRRIAAQLPSISDKVNQSSKIKVGIALDDSAVSAQAGAFVQKINQKVAANKVGVKLGIDQESIAKLQTELGSLHVDSSITNSMVEQIDKMGIRIDRVSGSWKQVADSERQLLALTIQGTDETGKAVSYLQTYDAETQEISTTMTNVTLNLEQQRKSAAALAKQVEKDNQSRLNFLSKQQIEINKINASYTGQSSQKPIVDPTRLESFGAKVTEINNKITALKAASGALSGEQQREIVELIANAKALGEAYRTLERAPTKLRTKDVVTIRDEELSKLDAYKTKLANVGNLTQDFASRIDRLHNELSGASDGAALTKYLNQFSTLSAEVKSFDAQVAGVIQKYNSLLSARGRATQISKKMARTSHGTEEYQIMATELARVKAEQAKITQEIMTQAHLAPEVVAAAKARSQHDEKIVQQNYELAVAEGRVKDAVTAINNEMASMPQKVAELQARFSALANPTTSLATNIEKFKEQIASVNGNDGQDKVAAYEKLLQILEDCTSEVTHLEKLSRLDVADSRFESGLAKAKQDLITIETKWSALKNDPGLNEQLNQLKVSLGRVNSQADFSKWKAQLSTFRAEVKAAGKDTLSLGDVFKNNLTKVSQWIGATTIIFKTWQTLRDGFDVVKDLDNALIDLKKTTDATEEQYRSFYYTANQTAKELGASTKDIIQQTADWARLGYSLDEASTLSRNSAIFSAVSEDLDLTEATDGLVSMLKAFKELDVNDSLDGIISKINEVGNNFAVSNADIVDSLTRSSSAMAAANNTFEQTVALATAATEITRDSSQVGNALKTISMRLRGYDEETETYSDDLKEITGDIANLTKVASNNNQGISLFEADDPNTYRSTYDILKDIADIWNEISDKNQAQLLEKLFGKQRAQVGAALISNFKQAENAMDAMAGSAGSASKELERAQDSIVFKLNALKETWVGVAQNLYDTRTIKNVIDLLTDMSGVIQTITKSLGTLGTVSAGVLGVQFIRSVGRPKMTGSHDVPTYALVVTRNELAA
jgi:TP901 family phage tail tape measure protein|nr:MAG TPA: minor tail protein [Caudoviricetes sp.]